MLAGAATVVAGAEPSAPTGGSAPPRGIPEGWFVVHEEHFDTADTLGRFVFTDPAAWRWARDSAGFSLELVRQSRYQPPHRSPFNLALIADRQFGDFVLEVDLVQTGKEYGHRDMVLAFGVQDPAHFYYVHLATAADDHAHNIFLVDGSPRRKFARKTTRGVNWGLGVWHRVRLERRLADGSIRVYFDDMAEPVMEAEDRMWGMGWVGVGSFDDTGKVDNLRLWSPTEPLARSAEFFGRGLSAVLLDEGLGLGDEIVGVAGELRTVGLDGQDTGPSGGL